MAPTSTLDVENGNARAVNEQTPLLHGYDEQSDLGKTITKNGEAPLYDDDATATTEEDEKPMPYVQILTLCYCALAEPVACFGIFPFINEMLERTGGVPEADVGFWAGLIESLFSIVQMVLMIFYGQLSDRVGRKPVLVFSMVGISLSTAAFGMGQHLWQMILLRCLAGVFAGSAVTIRSMISEHCTKSTQGRAFSWFMFSRNMGILIGSSIGGGFANPAEQFPTVFNAPFWRQYPYALSSWALGVVALSTVFASAFILTETLERKTDGQTLSKPELSTWEVLRSPGVPIVLFIYSFVMLIAFMYTAVSPVCMYTSVHNGGFGFSDQQIALFMGIVGISQSLWQLLVFPSLHRAVGTGNIFRGGAIFHPFFMALYPVGNELLRHGLNNAFWVVTPIGVALGSGVAMLFACVQLMVNDISPSKHVLGTMNALALTATSGVRAFGPVLGTSIYAAGVKWGFADGHLMWFVLIACGLGLTVLSWFVPEAAEGRVPPKKARGNTE